MRPVEPVSLAAGRAPAAALLSLVASGVVWGLVWWPLKFFAAAGLTGHAIGLTAYSLVGLTAVPWIWRERDCWRGEAHLLAIIALCFGCANLAFTGALTTGSVVRAMLLFYLLPAWGALGGAVVLKERLGPRRLAAVALSLAGVAVILGGFDAFEQPLSTADGMALAAGFCYAAAGIANRKARQIPMASRTLAAFIGCVVVSVAGLLVSTPAIPHLAVSTWIWLVLFAFCWLLGATLLTTYGVTHVQASRAAVLQVVELLVAVLSVAWLGSEGLGPKEWVGAAMIVFATLLEAGAS